MIAGRPLCERQSRFDGALAGDQAVECPAGNAHTAVHAHDRQREVATGDRAVERCRALAKQDRRQGDADERSTNG
jgi:hypothetical protein